MRAVSQFFDLVNRLVFADQPAHKWIADAHAAKALHNPQVIGRQGDKAVRAYHEDLVKEASDMLKDSKNQLASDIGPLIGKARSLKEGQDLKTAYETFLEILKIEPTNSEALNEVDDIRNTLESRSKRIYREAIIAESLSLFGDAKEKLQEVQQISPTDSEYYKKASDKLKNYLE